jgi:hypothetical protein
MNFYLPVSRLNGNPAGNIYLYLYSQFGATGNLTGSTTKGKGKNAVTLSYGQDLTSNAGFEEWTAVPEPGTYALVLLLSMGGLFFVKRRMARREKAPSA